MIDRLTYRIASKLAPTEKSQIVMRAHEHREASDGRLSDPPPIKNPDKPGLSGFAVALVS